MGSSIKDGVLGCEEKDLSDLTAYKDNTNEAAGFRFTYNGDTYAYSYKDETIRRN